MRTHDHVSGKLISCVVHNPSEFPSVSWVEPDMFAEGVHGAMWEVILDSFADGDTDDLMIAVLERLHPKPSILQMFTDLVRDVGPLGTGSAGFYAEKLSQEAHRREVLVAAHRAVDLAGSTDADDLDDVMRDLWDGTLNGSRRMRDDTVPGLHHLPDFLSFTSSSAFDWVIPGLLEHQERFILVAPIKSGKSVLTRQVALCVAAGRHPFDPRYRIPQKRVLMIDLENPGGVLRRDLKRQLPGVGDVEGLWVLHQPAGIDLGNGVDRRMLERAIVKTRPDLVCLGPLYKAYDALDESWEKQAAGVQKPIDRWRSDYGCSFWIEHHASKSDPTGLFGSSRWARWFDMKVALIPEDPAQPPPYRALEWQATYRDSRRMRPELIEMTEVKVLGEVSWRARFIDTDPFDYQMQHACEE